MEWISMERISVEERLPEKGLEVIAWADHGTYHVYFFDPERWVTMTAQCVQGVTHWMSLPDPPSVPRECEEGKCKTCGWYQDYDGYTVPKACFALYQTMYGIERRAELGGWGIQTGYPPVLVSEDFGCVHWKEREEGNPFTICVSADDYCIISHRDHGARTLALNLSAMGRRHLVDWLNSLWRKRR